MITTIQDANDLIKKARGIVSKSDDASLNDTINTLIDKLEKGVLDHDFEGDNLPDSLTEDFKNLEVAVGP